ncbi:hypothetical protein Tco_0979791 [Tanacetum coccineum]
MLEKSLYDSWKSRMELYIENQENRRMILNSLQNGSLVWPTILEEDGTTWTKKYEELFVAEKLQVNCDLKAINIVLQGLPPDVYAIVNHHKVAKEIWDGVKLLMEGTKLSLQEKECLVVPMFNQGDDPISCLNKAVAFLIAVASSRQGQSYVGNSYKGNATSSGGNNAGGQAKFKKKEMLAEAQEARQILDEEKLAFLVDPGIPDGKAAQTTIPNTTAFQTEDLDAYDSNCDDVSNAKVVLMANLSNYGSDVISEVPHHEPYYTDMDNQKTQQAAVQDTNLYAQQDSMILSVIEQMSEQMINHVNNWEKANQEKNNESLTAELERYKERVKTFEQRLNIDLSTCEKMIDSQMDDMIKEKFALKQQIDSLEQNLSNQRKGIFIANIYLHMLTKPQVFYDDTHKQALGYQNPFYLKKAQQIKPTLYDGSVISSQHAASPVIDDEETLILEEVKLFDEQAFWLQTSHPNTDQSASSPVQIEAPKELPKVKYHLGQFDAVVKKRITPDAITEGE